MQYRERSPGRGSEPVRGRSSPAGRPQYRRYPANRFHLHRTDADPQNLRRRTVFQPPQRKCQLRPNVTGGVPPRPIFTQKPKPLRHLLCRRIIGRPAQRLLRQLHRADALLRQPGLKAFMDFWWGHGLYRYIGSHRPKWQEPRIGNPRQEKAHRRSDVKTSTRRLSGTFLRPLDAGHFSASDFQSVAPATLADESFGTQCVPNSSLLRTTGSPAMETSHNPHL